MIFFRCIYIHRALKFVHEAPLGVADCSNHLIIRFPTDGKRHWLFSTKVVVSKAHRHQLLFFPGS